MAAVRGYAESLDSSDLDSPDEFGLDQDEDDPLTIMYSLSYDSHLFGE